MLSLELPRLLPLLGTAFLLALVAVPLASYGMRVLHRLAPPNRAPRARWRPYHSLVVVLAGLAAALPVAAWRPPDDGLYVLLVSGLVLCCAALMAVLRARRAQPDGWAAQGFPAGGRLRPAGAALAAYVLCYPLVFGVGILSSQLAQACGVELPPQEVATHLLGLEGLRLALALVLGILVLPFLEELLFRGFLQPSLVRWTGTAGGIASTSLLFALLHGLTAFAPIFVLSLLLGAVRQRTGRLDAAWAVHALHNGWMLFLLLRFPDVVGGNS